MNRIIRHFFLNMTRTALYVLLMLTVIAVLNIPMTSVTAVVASIGVTLGLTIQGALSSFVDGITLTLTRPFTIGDYVEAAQVGSTVDKIGLSYTVLIGIGNRKITVPNGSPINVNIADYSSMAKRHLDLTFLTGRDEDPERVKEVLWATIMMESAVLQPPDAIVILSVTPAEPQGESLLFTLRVWRKNPNCWNSNFTLTERVAKAFQKEHTSPSTQSYRAVAEDEEG